VQRSFLIFATAFIAMMAGVLFYAARVPVQQAAPAAEEPAESTETAPEFAAIYPSFTLPDVDGTPHEFSEWEGKHRLMNFWATWCAPCRREIPLLKAFQEEHGDEGFLVIGIAVDYPKEVATYAEKTNFNYPILVGQEEAMAAAETSGVEFIGLPFTMIVAADGELINTHVGEIKDSHLEHIYNVITMLDNGEIDKESAREALNFL